MDSSEKEACFSDEIFHLKKKNHQSFWIPCFGWIRNVLGPILSKKTVLDDFFGHYKERPKILKVGSEIDDKKYFEVIFFLSASIFLSKQALEEGGGSLE